MASNPAKKKAAKKAKPMAKWQVLNKNGEDCGVLKSDELAYQTAVILDCHIPSGRPYRVVRFREVKP